MTKFRPIQAHYRHLLFAVVGTLSCLAYPLQVSAGMLGRAVVRADGNEAVVIEIPVSVPREAVAMMTGGVRGDASCAECTAPALQAAIGKSTEGGGVLRITGAVPENQPYLEFQAWIEWEQEGRVSGDLRNYKVLLPPGEKAASLPPKDAVLPATAAIKTDAREQPTGAPAPKQVARGAARSGAAQYEAVAAEVDAERFVSDWLKAWSSRNMEQYFSFYAEDFRLPVGVSRSGWESLRRQRIFGRKGLLEVSFEKLVVESATPDRLEVRFVQKYRSAGYSSIGVKSMLLVMRDGAWKIAAESISDERPLPN